MEGILSYVSVVSLEVLRNTMQSVRISGPPAEIRTPNFANTKPDCEFDIGEFYSTKEIVIRMGVRLI
jgi:hypothetical protein